MNEITRIHIAKTAYDIEIAAKKQLEKYIKSLESYTQDTEVLQDIEIRITELLAERGVKAGGVIATDDVAAIRIQLGEPHEFADEDGDIAVGATPETTNRRLYRSTDTAVLGGVLSGIATYYNVNPLWTRLVFILLLFISFGLASLVYILFWVIIPPARTVTEKLRLAGKDVTVESIKALSSDEDVSASRVAPLLQQIIFVTLGIVSLLSAVAVSVFTIWLAITTVLFNDRFISIANGYIGYDNGSGWILWLVYGIVLLGCVLLAALFGLIAYAFLAKKLTKRIVISGITLMILGVISVATVIGIVSTQSLRAADEARSMVAETKTTLPADFSKVNSLKINYKSPTIEVSGQILSTSYVSIRYIVDGGPARYEWSALPTSKAIINANGQQAEVTIDIPNNYRNSFVQSSLTIYGPALTTIETNLNASSTQISYDGQTQNELTVLPQVGGSTIVTTGTYEKVTVKGSGFVQLGSSTIRTLVVQAQQSLSVTAGTVNTLDVTQPNVCPVGTYGGGTSVTVSEVASGEIVYNGTKMPAQSIDTTCGIVTIGGQEEGYREEE